MEYKSTDEGVLFDIKPFMEGVGGRLTPIYQNIGIVAQYGKRIGFSTNGKEYDMVRVKLCKMEPPCRVDAGRLWAPKGFLETVLDGTVTLNEADGMINVTAPPPTQIGDIVPEAQDITQALTNLDYTVQQGEICLSNAIDVCYAGYSPNANGNNANFPYFITQAPLPREADHSILPQQFVYTVGEDEGFIMIGKEENRDMKGIDYGEEAFIGFRNYIDPYSPDLIGPDPEKIIFERAMVLTPK